MRSDVKSEPQTNIDVHINGTLATGSNYFAAILVQRRLPCKQIGRVAFFWIKCFIFYIQFLYGPVSYLV